MKHDEEGTLRGVMSLDPRAPREEDGRTEFKSARGGIPLSMWETYSAFANSHGGTIVLGVSERNGITEVTGIEDPKGMVKSIWDVLGNPNKVSKNLLRDEDVRIEECEGRDVIVVRVPRARHDDRPVFINGNRDSGTYRRGGEGDYHCTRSEIDAMIRDSGTRSPDEAVLPFLGMDDLDMDAVRRYRNNLRAHSPDHYLNDVDDGEFLKGIQAMGTDENGTGLTVAGALMFGKEYCLSRYNSYMRLDYRETEADENDWTYRIVSGDGRFVCNLFNFYHAVAPRLMGIPGSTPGIGDNWQRTDDTDLHKALREGLLNAIVHADYSDRMGILIVRRRSSVTMENAGTFRIPLSEAAEGGHSDPRNPILAKMFSMIGLTERAGLGVRRIMTAWRDGGMVRPEYRESFEPATSVSLKLVFVSGSLLSEEDMFILRELRADGTMTVKDLAERMGISGGSVFARIKELKSKGFLRRVGGTRGRWEVADLRWMVRRPADDG